MLSTSLNVSSSACPTWSRWWMRLSTAGSHDMVSLTEADGRIDTGAVHSCLQLVFFSFVPDTEFSHWTDARCSALFARMLTRWHSIFSRLSKFGSECSDCWLCVMHDPSPVWVSQRMRSAVLVMTMEAAVYTRSVCHCWKSQSFRIQTQSCWMWQLLDRCTLHSWMFHRSRVLTAGSYGYSSNVKYCQYYRRKEDCGQAVPWGSSRDLRCCSDGECSGQQ